MPFTSGSGGSGINGILGNAANQKTYSAVAASNGTNVFTLSSPLLILNVYLNGLLLQQSEYLIASNQVTLIGLTIGDNVQIIYY